MAEDFHIIVIYTNLMHIGEQITITGMCNHFKVDSNLYARDWNDVPAEMAAFMPPAVLVEQLAMLNRLNQIN